MVTAAESSASYDPGRRVEPLAATLPAVRAVPDVQDPSGVALLGLGTVARPSRHTWWTPRGVRPARRAGHHRARAHGHRRSRPGTSARRHAAGHGASHGRRARPRPRSGRRRRGRARRGYRRCAAEVTRAAIEQGKAVVTANKAVLAAEGAALESAARATGSSSGSRRAVGAGIPVLGPLVTDLAANRIDAVRGIVNGTTNHILTAMARDARRLRGRAGRGAGSAATRRRTRAADVEGDDAVHKLCAPRATRLRRVARLHAVSDGRPSATRW